jgi:phospholipid/cholesterol/gamma-HCH transport system permease protein
VLGSLGRHVIAGLSFFGEISTLHLRTLVHISRRAIDYRSVVTQMAQIGVNSLPIAAVTMLFVGMVFCYHIANEAVTLGLSGFVGWAVAETICRELGPGLTALVVAARAGSAMAAEIGTMKVTEQIDALRTMATDPVEYLVVPRYLAALVTVPMLALLGDAVGVFGGYIMANATAAMTADQYFNTIPARLEVTEVAAGIFKAVFFGIIIAIVGCHQGLSCRMAAEEVGHATTRAVVYCIMLIYAADLILTMIVYP